jgi:hypothetical protein
MATIAAEGPKPSEQWTIATAKQTHERKTKQNERAKERDKAKERN